MELKQYGAIIWARWWLVALLAVVAFGVSVAYTPQSVTSYTSSVRLAVKPQSQALSDTYGEYYLYLASEYLNDDIGKVIESAAFASALRARAQQKYGSVPGGSFEVKKAHRVLTVEATSRSADDALRMTQVASEMLMEPQNTYFDSVSAQKPVISIVDPPTISSTTPPSRVGLDIAVRTVLGLLLGIALAFVLHYLDDTIRTRADLEEGLGLSVLGEIPRDKRAIRAVAVKTAR